MTKEERRYLRENLQRNIAALFDAIRNVFVAGEISLAQRLVEEIGTIANRETAALNAAGNLYLEVKSQARRERSLQDAEAKLREVGLLAPVEYIEEK